MSAKDIERIVLACVIDGGGLEITIKRSIIQRLRGGVRLQNDTVIGTTAEGTHLEMHISDITHAKPCP